MIIRSLQILTPDLTATKEFYQDLLQVKIIDASHKHISFEFGHSVCTFHETNASHPFYHIAFSIPNNKLIEAMQWVAQRTALLPYSPGETIADFTGWNAKAFYFHDSQQNILEFITHYDLQTTVEEPFSAACITGICEIGITVPDVAKACTYINNSYVIPYFPKGPLLKDFAVMGDACGMFIISKTGRGWLPTQRPSEQHWTKVLIENNGTKRELEFK